ncbi:MAG: TlpA disulfide reductase family protein [Balneolaceae bacterium]
MKHYNVTLIPVLILTFFLIGCSGGESSEEETDGSPESIVENAIFTDLDGNDVSVKDFEGSVILIDFWESWCGPCLQVFPSMEELRSEYPDEFQVLAVTVGLNEGPEEARAFAEEHGYDFHFLYDEYGVFDRLGGQGIPFKAYIDPDGNFIKIEMGSYGRQGDYDRAKELVMEYFDE